MNREAALNIQKQRSAALQDRLDDAVCSGRIYWYSEVGSTNDVAWELVSDTWDGQPLVVLADYQKRGRGRFGAKWISPPEQGLLLSIVTPVPKVNLASAFTGACALGVSDAALERCGVGTYLKWPNDIMAGGKKLSGVLVECKQVNGENICIMGIGVNVNNTRELLPPDFSSITTSIRLESESGQEIDREMLAVEVIERTLEYRNMIVGEKKREFCTVWGDHLDIIDGSVLITGDSSGRNGLIKSINIDGTFVVDVGGEEQIYSFDDFICLSREN